jgi:hypothetical protein
MTPPSRICVSPGVCPCATWRSRHSPVRGSHADGPHGRPRQIPLPFGPVLWWKAPCSLTHVREPVRILAYSVTSARTRPSVGLWPRRPDAPLGSPGSPSARWPARSCPALSRRSMCTPQADTSCLHKMSMTGREADRSGTGRTLRGADSRTGLIRRARMNILGQPIRVLQAGNPSRALEGPGTGCSRRVHPERSLVRIIAPGLPKGYQAVTRRDRDTLDQRDAGRAG